MALTRTLAQLRDSVERTAGISAFVGTGKRHSTASVNDLINRGLGALQRVTAVVNPEFRPVASDEITFDGAATEYALASNCRSVISVEYTDDNGGKTWLTPFEMHERAALTTPTTRDNSVRAHHYRVLGTNIEFLPRPPDGHTALYWYATTANQLSADADTVDVYDRLDDYVVWWAAREIAMDREDYDRHDRLTQKIAALESDIQVIARQRDISHPSRIVNLSHADRFGRTPRRGWGY
jgi:hypothetical protein